MASRSRKLCGCAILVVALMPMPPLLAALGSHDTNFWKAIAEHNFTVPPNESANKLALEIVDLAGNTDPVLRDDCGYEIFAAWIYRQQLLSAEQLEELRRKLLPGMVYHLGESDTDTVFRRSFSALYMSILAAQDLQRPFLSEAAFKETLDVALQCCAGEKDLSGYMPEKGWAHATAHVADLLKFLGRNTKLSAEDQKRIVAGISQRCRTTTSVFIWGEDGRMAAALLSIVDRKDFEPKNFDEWFNGAIIENKELWKTTDINPAAYVKVRTQANVITQLVAKMAVQKDNEIPRQFRDKLNATLAQID